MVKHSAPAHKGKGPMKESGMGMKGGHMMPDMPMHGKAAKKTKGKK